MESSDSKKGMALITKIYLMILGLEELRDIYSEVQTMMKDNNPKTKRRRKKHT